MKAQIKSSTFILFSLLILSWQLVDVFQAGAQRMPTNPLPQEERKLRDELEQDSSITQIPCFRAFNEETKDQKLLEARKANNQVKLSLYNAASNKRVMKAKKLCSTLEGTIIASYLLINEGKISMIVDYSRDGFSSGRVYSDTCSNLTL